MSLEAEHGRNFGGHKHLERSVVLLHFASGGDSDAWSKRRGRVVKADEWVDELGCVSNEIAQSYDVSWEADELAGHRGHESWCRGRFEPDSPKLPDILFSLCMQNLSLKTSYDPGKSHAVRDKPGLGEMRG